LFSNDAVHTYRFTFCLALCFTIYVFSDVEELDVLSFLDSCSPSSFRERSPHSFFFLSFQSFAMHCAFVSAASTAFCICVIIHHFFTFTFTSLVMWIFFFRYTARFVGLWERFFHVFLASGLTIIHGVALYHSSRFFNTFPRWWKLHMARAVAQPERFLDFFSTLSGSLS
jgi:hypothetical protein